MSKNDHHIIFDLFDLIINELENNNQQIALAMILKLKVSQEEQFWEYFSNKIKNKYSPTEIFSALMNILEMSEEEATLSILRALTTEEEGKFKEYGINEIKSKFHHAEEIEHNINEFEKRLMQIKQSGKIQKEPECTISSSCIQRKSRKQSSDSEVPQPILTHFNKTNPNNYISIENDFNYQDDDNVPCCCFRF